jgi:hypothetical protein
MMLAIISEHPKWNGSFSVWEETTPTPSFPEGIPLEENGGGTKPDNLRTLKIYTLDQMKGKVILKDL